MQGQPIAGVNVRVTHYQTLWYEAAGDAPAWPAPATTDAQGRFELRGLSNGEAIALEARSDRHGPQRFEIDPRELEKARELTFTLTPGQVIEVHVTRADDGKPIPGAWVSVSVEFAKKTREFAAGSRRSHRRPGPTAGHPCLWRHLLDHRQSARPASLI